MEHAKWKHLVSQHLGRKYTRRSEDLMWDLTCVDCGLKPALLLDFTAPSVVCVIALLHDLKSAGLLTNHLTVVTIEMDLLIVSPPSFSDITESSKNPLSDALFVDVSGNLDGPRVFEKSHLLQQTKQSFFGVLEQLDSVSSVDLSLGSQTDQCANPSTLFGLFLGYPVVYYYDMILDSQDNCLSMVPLVNFVLKGTVETKDGRQCTREHVISSFTVPQSFMDMAASRVDAWFEEKRERGLQCKLFHKLDLERRVVQLPSVCL